MILYTIYDPNVIFKDEGFGDRQVAAYSEMSVNGTRVQVSQTNLNEDIRVERIICTNPADYLNPKIQPGCIIKK